MEAIRLDTIVEHDGRIIVPGVKAGEAVEVIVLLKTPRVKAYPLRSTGGVYKAPFEPAIPETEWDSQA